MQEHGAGWDLTLAVPCHVTCSGHVHVGGQVTATSSTFPHWTPCRVSAHVLDPSPPLFLEVFVNATSLKPSHSLPAGILSPPGAQESMPHGKRRSSVFRMLPFGPQQPTGLGGHHVSCLLHDTQAALDEGGESVKASAAWGSRDRAPRPGNGRKRMAELA